MCLYYAVLVERKPTGIGIFETLMYIWIAAFAYDELSGMTDAGVAFYQMDFWKIWNLGIIGTGVAFVIASELLCLVSIQLSLSQLNCALCRRTGRVKLQLTNGALGIVGLARESDAVTDISFDILSLEALFLVPRYVRPGQCLVVFGS